MTVGEFLRARRGQVTPQQFGLPTRSRRRVSGLRREEVATLAGLSVDYYARLEQGRERHPSPQVLRAIAEALGFDDDAYQHLFRIAGFTPALRTAALPERVDPHLAQLMGSWPEHPALLLGRTYDVLARNPLGTALWQPFTYSNNLLLNIFLDDAATAFYRHWRAAAVNTVTGFRAAAQRRTRRPASNCPGSRTPPGQPRVRRDLGPQRRPRQERRSQDLRPSRRG